MNVVYLGQGAGRFESVYRRLIENQDTISVVVHFWKPAQMGTIGARFVDVRKERGSGT